jgi:hypothetical protein
VVAKLRVDVIFVSPSIKILKLGLIYIVVWWSLIYPDPGNRVPGFQEHFELTITQYFPMKILLQYVIIIIIIIIITILLSIIFPL